MNRTILSMWRIVLICVIGSMSPPLLQASPNTQSLDTAHQATTSVPTTLASAAAILRRGTLNVWTSTRLESFNSLSTLGTMQAEFKQEFPEFDLRINRIAPDEFITAVHAARGDATAPDVAFIENYGQLGPLIAENAVVKMWGHPRFGRGWWVIIRSSRATATAKAFMLWLAQSPQWKPWTPATTSIAQDDRTAVESIAKEAVKDFCSGNRASLWSHFDAQAARFDDFGVDGPQTVLNVQPLLTIGNSRLAVVLVAAVAEGQQTFGMTHSAVVLRKSHGQWKVLTFLPNGMLPSLENLLRNVDQLGLQEGPPEAPPPVALVGPSDHAQLQRFPRPDLEWGPVQPGFAAFVVESQYGQHGNEYWSSSAIAIVTAPAPGNQTYRATAPFGIGQQPHRWRVWSINKAGVLSISEWRTIDFTT